MPIIETETLDREELLPYASLTDSGMRQNGLFIAESPKVIDRAIEAGIHPLSLLCERRHIRGDAAPIIGRFPEMPVFTGDRELLASLTGYTLTRGVLCAMRRPEPTPAVRLASKARRVCVIYDVCDATNVGAIFRSAAALGFDAVILSAESCDALNRRAIRVSMGTVFQIPWSVSANVLEDLRAAGLTTVSTALNAESIPLDRFPLRHDGRYAVIFGSEGYGLPDSVIRGSDFCVNIPMQGGVDSLNVGAAAAITLWHFRP